MDDDVYDWLRHSRVGGNPDKATKTILHFILLTHIDTKNPSNNTISLYDFSLVNNFTTAQYSEDEKFIYLVP